jgi:hypothetical protein
MMPLKYSSYKIVKWKKSRFLLLKAAFKTVVAVDVIVVLGNDVVL